MYFLDTYENMIIDYNKDSVKEILTTYAIGLNGSGDRLFSLKGMHLKLLYENFSNWGKSLQNNLIKGDTITTTFEIKFDDYDSDGIDEIFEKKNLGIYQGTVGNNIVQKYIDKEKIFKINY